MKTEAYFSLGRKTINQEMGAQPPGPHLRGELQWDPTGREASSKPEQAWRHGHRAEFSWLLRVGREQADIWPYRGCDRLWR